MTLSVAIHSSRRPMQTHRFHRIVLAVALAHLAGLVAAQPLQPPPHGVLGLASSASVEVPRDLLQLTFSITRDGPDASAIQAQLKQALDAALGEARKAARPGQV